MARGIKYPVGGRRGGEGGGRGGRGRRGITASGISSSYGGCLPQSIAMVPLPAPFPATDPPACAQRRHRHAPATVIPFADGSVKRVGHAPVHAAAPRGSLFVRPLALKGKGSRPPAGRFSPPVWRNPPPPNRWGRRGCAARATCRLHPPSWWPPGGGGGRGPRWVPPLPPGGWALSTRAGPPSSPPAGLAGCPRGSSLATPRPPWRHADTRPVQSGVVGENTYISLVENRRQHPERTLKAAQETQTGT